MWRGIEVTKNESDPKAPAHVALSEQLDDSILMPGDVTIDVEFSSLNYKDGIALTGKPGIVRAPHLIAGIDLVGVVAESTDERYEAGQRVLVTGCGLSETHHGGFAERARVPGDWVVPVPAGISNHQAAAIGTAGFTAMLSVLAIERGGVSGEVLVTGAAGGVGSVAIALLSKLGYSVTASTGRESEHDYLRSLGATTIIDRAELSAEPKALMKQRWAGAIDAVGGTTLASAIAATEYGGTVTACGNAQSSELHTSVMPFILRGVSLVGINSVFTPRELRLEAWSRLERDLDLASLESTTSTIGLSNTIAAGADIMAGRIRGRTVVDVHG
ncbi:MDR family oxidoreductase [Salinibacterium sp. SWN1162]|uniref:MDR family oxidoreductase n=1 Tax=Salinibacterium sp. SWN1162 TaxID=2792053 RepID=UPI0018CD5152|nr:MDR family oxidoreductase [Salinibacterium sp. SWN1162]MBH0007923.1 oxidoreductase [Salinibacterium sp. SWN1162]